MINVMDENDVIVLNGMIDPTDVIDLTDVLKVPYCYEFLMVRCV